MKLFWTTQKRKIKDLMPAEYNPRQMTEAQAKELRKSLQKFDLVEIPAIDEDGTILAGHMRVATLIDLGRGEEEIDVRVPNRKLTDKEAMEYNLRSNKNTGEWDMDKLFAMPEELLGEVGFSNKEIQKLIDGHTEAKEDDYDPEEGLKLPCRVEKGDLWQLGSHRLLCGDSTQKQAVEKLMDGKKADMVFTDMPYGIGKEGIENDDLEGVAFKNFNRDFMAQFPLKEDVCFVTYHSPRVFPVTIQVAEEEGWKFERIFTFFRPDKFPCHTWNGWMMTSQVILLFSKGNPEYRDVSPAHQDVFTVTSKDLRDGGKGHPTIKPVGHLRDMLAHFVADLVYEPFLGSGSTLIACEQTGRTCYGMEIDPKYCTIILDRWEKLTGQKAVKVE